MNTRKTPFALSPPEQRRVDAVDRLAAIGEAGLPELLEMLSDRSWTVRRAVVSSLAAMGDTATGPLCALLRTARDDEARISAVMDALASSMGDPLPCLVELLDDRNPAPVADAAIILGRRREPAAVPVLVGLIEHADDNVAVAAIEALGRIGGRTAVDALIEVVATRRFFRVFPAMDVLGRSGDPRAVGPLTSLLNDPQYATDAARALAHTADRNAVAPLAALLDRPGDAHVRLGAVALADLRGQVIERYGRAGAIDDTLRRAAAVPAAVVRLIQALQGAAVAEQVAICTVLGVIGGDAATSALTQMLDGPERVSTAAAEALELVGASADIPVRQALREGDSATRRSLLALVDRPSALEEVLLCLRDDDPVVRALACEALGRIGNPTAVRGLFRMLADPVPSVAQAAVAAIQVLGSPETETLARTALGSESAWVRRAALGILAYFGNPSALDLFLAALDDQSPLVREAAIVGLPFIDAPRAIDAVLAATRAAVARTRGAAMRALAFCGTDPRTEANLLRGLSDDDPWVRYYACQSLGRIGCESAAESIAALLGDEAGQVRVSAIEALSHLTSPTATEALYQAARASDPDVRRAALVGIGLARASAGLPILLDAVRSADNATRLIAVSALAGFDEAEAVAALQAAASDSEPTVRTAAASVLAASAAPGVIDVLVGLVRRDPDDGAVARALGTPAPGRIDEIAGKLEHADDDLALRLVAALARMTVPEATAALVRAMTAANPAARKASASALMITGSGDARRLVEQAARQDPDPDVRRVCGLLIGE